MDVVNLGSNSGLYAFDYNGLDITGMNWAVGPQSLVHDFNVLKNYFSYIKEGGIVIITLCPFSSLVSQYSKQQNLKYYTFLHPATILGFDEVEREKALRIKQNPIREMPWLCIKRTLKEFLKHIIHKPYPKCDMEKSAITFLEGWKKLFAIVDLDAPLSDKLRMEQENRTQILSDLIDFCLERELKPVLVIPPVHPLLAKKLTKKCRENYIYSFVRKANSQNVPFLDFMDDAGFQRDEFFSNAYFMSKKGAKAFTEQVLKKMSVI